MNAPVGAFFCFIENVYIYSINISMSKSIHTTYKSLRGLTKIQIEEQFASPYSDLATLGKKRSIKKTVKTARKNIKQLNRLKDNI